MTRLVVLLLLGVGLASAATTGRLKDSTASRAATRDPEALQFLLKERRGSPAGRPSTSVEQIFEKRRNWDGVAHGDPYRHRQPSFDNFYREGGHETYDEYQDTEHYGYDGSPDEGQQAHDSSPGTDYATERNVNQLSFSGAHVSRHPSFSETTSSPQAKLSFRTRDPSDSSKSTIPQSSIKSSSPDPSFAGFSPLFSTYRPTSSPDTADGDVAQSAAKAGQNRDDFLHHTSSSYDDPHSYHVHTTHHEPVTYHEEDGKAGALGSLGKYGGLMAPLLLATGLLFLFPSVQTITSTSSRRRRRDLGDADVDPAEKNHQLVERLQIIYASLEEDGLCPSRLFCQLGDIISDSPDPARVLKYMDHFYPGEERNLKIMKEAVYAEDSKCHMLTCDTKINEQRSDKVQQ